MRRPFSHPLLGLLLGSTALCGAVVAFERGPDPVIFPKQTIPIFFTHDYHTRTPDAARGVVGEGLDCDFCHENISDSQSSHDRDIPGHGSCDSCHAEWIGEEDKPAPTAQCARCHRDLDPVAAQSSTAARPLDIPPPNIRFAHKTHVDAQVACVECHSQVPQKTVATRDDYPTMDRCIACHEKSGAPTTCTTCHFSTNAGKLVTQYAQGQLKPNRFHMSAIHDKNFLKDHAVPAQRDKVYCENCHQENFCLDCHDGVGRDVRYHPGDWISTHYIRAKQDDVRCQSCHRTQSFCLSCHIRSGVTTVVDVQTPYTEVRRTTRQNDRGEANGPHPMTADGWLNPASRNFHGFHAQRNIRACASCHQEQYCLRCHMSKFKTGAPASIGGNPHGPNPQRFKDSTAGNRNARMCLKCHHPQDESWR